jgi:hypothetical protein
MRVEKNLPPALPEPQAQIQILFSSMQAPETASTSTASPGSGVPSKLKSRKSEGQRRARNPIPNPRAKDRMGVGMKRRPPRCSVLSGFCRKPPTIPIFGSHSRVSSKRGTKSGEARQSGFKRRTSPCEASRIPWLHAAAKPRLRGRASNLQVPSETRSPRTRSAEPGSEPLSTTRTSRACPAMEETHSRRGEPALWFTTTTDTQGDEGGREFNESLPFGFKAPPPFEPDFMASQPVHADFRHGQPPIGGPFHSGRARGFFQPG